MAEGKLIPFKKKKVDPFDVPTMKKKGPPSPRTVYGKFLLDNSEDVGAEYGEATLCMAEKKIMPELALSSEAILLSPYYDQWLKAPQVKKKLERLETPLDKWESIAAEK
jgi:hypothetical protein